MSVKRVDQILIPDGSWNVPGVAFESDARTGFSRDANTGRLTLQGGSAGIAFNGTPYGGVIGARMYKDTVTSLGSAGGTAAIAFNVVRFQDADFVTGASFKIPYDGYYYIGVRLALASQTVSSAGQLAVSVFKNDSTVIAMQYNRDLSVANSRGMKVVFGGIEHATVGTTYSVEAVCFSTAAVNLSSSSGTLLNNQEFEIYRIG